MARLAAKAASSTSVLEIDVKGFAQALSNKGKARILLEPISNALDTDTKRIDIFFEQSDGWASLSVSDYDPEGFADLAESYTLFAASRRRDDPTKRGRFGQGDKEFIAVCVQGGGSLKLATTTGLIHFTEAGRQQISESRTHGSLLEARLRLNQKEAREFERLLRRLLIPAGIDFAFNGDRLEERKPVRTAEASLPTKVADEEGNLVDATRRTTVELFEPLPNEEPMIYELGVPVVEHDGRFDINVGQKVPLASSRDNVNPAYLRRLRQIMLDEAHDMLTSVDMKKGWVTDALPKASPEALEAVVYGIHGRDAVIADPSNPEATKTAIDQGRSVIWSRGFRPEVWDRIREADILRPAGRVIETGVPTSPDGKPPIPAEDWTEAMSGLAAYVKNQGQFLLGFEPSVRFTVLPIANHNATWGGREITFNLGRLGKAWPAEASEADIDRLLIHEFSHERVADHLSHEFSRENCRLGAALRNSPWHIEPYRTKES